MSNYSGTKYPGLIQKMKEKAEEINYNTKEMYLLYDEFRDDYPELLYSTYSRHVRDYCVPSARGGYKKEDAQERPNHKVSVKEVTKNYTLQKNNEFKNKKIEFKDFNNKDFKRMVILSDLHCGHELGLTPPTWRYQENNPEKGQIARIQREAWEFYEYIIDNVVGKYADVLVINGDLIDGKANKNEGIELITTDSNLQVKIAIECIGLWNAKKIMMTRGTPYHVGKGECHEDIAADILGATIEDNLTFRFNGKVFNFRHKVGGSSVPYGKGTPLVKEAIWNTLLAEYNNTQRADIIVRSHVHTYVEYRDSHRIAIVTPALQVNSKYGTQQCSGYTDFGFLVVDVYDNGNVIIHNFSTVLKETYSEIMDI